MVNHGLSPMLTIKLTLSQHLYAHLCNPASCMNLTSVSTIVCIDLKFYNRRRCEKYLIKTKEQRIRYLCTNLKTKLIKCSSIYSNFQCNLLINKMPKAPGRSSFTPYKPGGKHSIGVCPCANHPYTKVIGYFINIINI